MRIAAALLAALAWCGAPAAGAPASPPPAAATGAGPFLFVDVAAEAGLSAPTWCGRPEKPHILESQGTGLALFDYDGDGDLDLYLVNGWRLAGAEVAERGRNLLYRNRGDGTFEDVTARAGVGDDGWGSGAAVGDVDVDGDLDLFVTNFGPDVLFLNQGDGTFRRAARSPGLDGWSAGATLFDADRDGDLDLFVAGYIDCTLEQVLKARPTLDWRGLKVMLGPFGLEGEVDAFFLNQGDGTFREATREAGLADVGRYYGFGAAAADLDGDLDLDLYVANDSNPNYLYRNDGRGRFEEMGLWSGAAVDAGGAGQASMGIAVGDPDGDADPDLFVTNFEDDTATLYQNQGSMLFADATVAAGLRDPTFRPLSWGTAFADFDLDGDLDLYIANGHIYPQADRAPGGSRYRQKNLLLAGSLAQGGRRFTDASAAAGPGLAVEESSRGLGVGDLDADGDLDLAISNVDAPPTLLRNDSRRQGAWLIVEAPGALRVEVEAGGRRWVRHRVAGDSYLSVNDTRFHFGLGGARSVDRLRAVYPDGGERVWTDLAVDRVYELGCTGAASGCRAPAGGPGGPGGPSGMR